MNLAQESFDISQLSGECTANEEFAHYHKKGVSLTTVDAENNIDRLGDEINLKKAEADKLTNIIVKNAENNFPPHIVAEEERQLNWVQLRTETLKKQLKNAIEFLDARLATKEEVIEEFVPFHYTQAKRYWDRIYTWCVQNEHKVNEKTKQRLYAKIQKARKTRSISSYYYWAISIWCIHRIDMPHHVKERQIERLMDYALARKTSAIGNGYDWGPKKEYECELVNDVEEDPFASFALSEDEMIEAIDIRRAG